jgi:hypothetical protein
MPPSSADRDRGVSMGVSAMADAFGAKVSVPVEGRSLFFVVGRSGAPDAAVQAAGGRVVVRLPDPRRVLALAPLEAHAHLRGHPDLALAGAVAVDAERFGAFARMIGLETERPPVAQPP